MNAREFDEKFSTSKSFKFVSGVGLAIFSSVMFVGWQKALSEVKSAEEPAAVSATAPETTTENPTAVAQSEPQLMASSRITEETPMVSEEGSMTLVSETVESSPSVTIAKAEVSEKTPMSAVTEITDPATLQDLKGKLYNQLDRNWQTIPTFSNHLVYRVQVKSNGAIASYEAINPAATDYVNEIPLGQLKNSKADMGQESVAKFLVMFTPGGLLEVNPWLGTES